MLEGIDADIDEGSTVALVGSSGAGKSTLASLLPRFFDAHRGRVCVDGIDVREVRLQELRTAIGIVRRSRCCSPEACARIFFTVMPTRLRRR